MFICVLKMCVGVSSWRAAWKMERSGGDTFVLAKQPTGRGRVYTSVYKHNRFKTQILGQQKVVFYRKYSSTPTEYGMKLRPEAQVVFKLPLS